jgi:hypothetical protein
VVGSIANGIATLIGMLVLAVVTLPLWLLAPLWPLIPLVIFAWANQRLLALRRARRALPTGRRCGRSSASAAGHLYLFGLLMALIAYVPVDRLRRPGAVRPRLHSLPARRARGA